MRPYTINTNTTKLKMTKLSSFTSIFCTAVCMLIISIFVTSSSAHAQITSSDIMDGDLIRATGTDDIYIVKIVGQKNFKRLILNPAIFDSYGHLRWENVKDVPVYLLNRYATSNLVREIYADGRPVNNNVYALFARGDSGTKRLVAGGSYDTDSVYGMNHIEASETFYVSGDPITLSGSSVVAGDDRGVVSSTLSAPTGLRVTMTSIATMNIQWTGIPGITKYRVEWRVAGTQNPYWNFSTTRTDATIWGHLIPNQRYEIRVQGVNIYDVGGAYAYTAGATFASTQTGSGTGTGAGTGTQIGVGAGAGVQSGAGTNTNTGAGTQIQTGAEQAQQDDGSVDDGSSLTSDPNEEPPTSTAVETSSGNSGATVTTTTEGDFMVQSVFRPDQTLAYKYYYRSDKTIAQLEAFRSSGILIYRAFYSTAGKLERADFYRLDGTLQTKNYYSADETLRTIDRYRESGVLVQRESYQYKEGKRLNTRSYFDDAGVLERREAYGDDGTLSIKEYYRSDGKTALYRLVYTDETIDNYYFKSDGTKERLVQYKVEDGNLLRNTYYYSNGQAKRVEHFREDTDKEVLLRVEYFYSDGKRDRTQEYDEKRHCNLCNELFISIIGTLTTKQAPFSQGACFVLVKVFLPVYIKFVLGYINQPPVQEHRGKIFVKPSVNQDCYNDNNYSNYFFEVSFVACKNVEFLYKRIS